MAETPGSFESLSIETKDHVAQVTLLGPGKGNAMGPAFWAELPVAFAALDADPDVRAIVLTGSGRNFSYGLDLPAMGGLLAPLLGGGLAKERADFHTALRAMQQAITAVADCRTPTIASIQGWCIGGGVDLLWRRVIAGKMSRKAVPTSRVKAKSASQSPVFRSS